MLTQVIRYTTPLALLLVLCGAYRLTLASPEVRGVTMTHSQPNIIAPRYDEPRIATDQQLFEVLDRVKPSAEVINTNILVHALRLWGPKAVFHDPDALDGPTMLAYFLDDAEFRRLAGDDHPSLFAMTPDGLRARPWEESGTYDKTGVVHVDDLLATLAESGVPLDAPLVTREGTYQVADLLEGAMARFHRQQHEYEWTGISFARYLFPTPQWDNRYGQRVDAGELIAELIEQPPANGICAGTHRLEALTVLNRADEAAASLSRRPKRQLLSHLAAMSVQLVQKQHSEGFWDTDWARPASEDSDASKSLYGNILATGHHLEWLAFAPPEVQPPREVIVRAGQWLVRAMLEIEEEELRAHYGPLSHAARALALWRNKQPYEAWVAFAPEETTTSRPDTPATAN